MMKRSICPVLALLLVILAVSQAGHARVAIGTLEGVVLDSHGKPVAGATVTAQTSDGTRPFATHSGADGHFHFTRFPIGQYDMRAYSHGMFSDWVKRIPVHTGKKTSVTLRLPPPADISVSVPK
jgi:hypothetical protein